MSKTQDEIQRCPHPQHMFELRKLIDELEARIVVLEQLLTKGKDK
jgi:hypothetical protein